MTPSIRPYQPADFEAVYALWQASLGLSWPITREYLRRMTIGTPCYRAGDHVVAERDGQIVGFAGTHIQNSGKVGGISLLIVSPDNQRQGIGTKLHNTALEHLRQQGIEKIGLAHGGLDYFWPGVPLNCPSATAFFQSQGWNFPETAYDLTCDLHTYRTPPGVLEGVAQQGIDLRHPLTPDEANTVLDFERRNFSFWLEYYQQPVEANRYADILAAWDKQTVIGAVLLEKADLTRLSPSLVWHSILGDNMGTIGAVGVDKHYQGQGIGLALVAKASEILQVRGVQQCLIGWTDLLGFYGKLGYTVWRAYAMSEDR